MSYSVDTVEAVPPRPFGIEETIWGEDMLSGTAINVDTNGLMVSYTYQGPHTMCLIARLANPLLNTVDVFPATTMFTPHEGEDYSQIKGRKVAFRRALKLLIHDELMNVDQWNDYESPDIPGIPEEDNAELFSVFDQLIASVGDLESAPSAVVAERKYRRVGPVDRRDYTKPSDPSRMRRKSGVGRRKGDRERNLRTDIANDQHL